MIEKVTPVEDLPPPIIHLGPSNQTRPMGSVAIMPCHAEGIPVPVITWYKDTNSFQLNHRVFTDDAGTLRINGKNEEFNILSFKRLPTRTFKFMSVIVCVRMHTLFFILINFLTYITVP